MRMGKRQHTRLGERSPWLQMQKLIIQNVFWSLKGVLGLWILKQDILRGYQWQRGGSPQHNENIFLLPKSLLLNEGIMSTNGCKCRHQWFPTNPHPTPGGVKLRKVIFSSSHNRKVILKKKRVNPTPSRFPRTHYENTIIETAKQQKMLLLVFIPTWESLYWKSLYRRNWTFCPPPFFLHRRGLSRFAKKDFCSAKWGWGGPLKQLFFFKKKIAFTGHLPLLIIIFKKQRDYFRLSGSSRMTKRNSHILKCIIGRPL